MVKKIIYAEYKMNGKSNLSVFEYIDHLRKSGKIKKSYFEFLSNVYIYCDFINKLNEDVYLYDVYKIMLVFDYNTFKKCKKVNKDVYDERIMIRDECVIGIEKQFAKNKLLMINYDIFSKECKYFTGEDYKVN